MDRRRFHGGEARAALAFRARALPQAAQMSRASPRCTTSTFNVFVVFLFGALRQYDVFLCKKKRQKKWKKTSKRRNRRKKDVFRCTLRVPCVECFSFHIQSSSASGFPSQSTESCFDFVAELGNHIMSASNFDSVTLVDGSRARLSSE